MLAVWGNACDVVGRARGWLLFIVVPVAVRGAGLDAAPKVGSVESRAWGNAVTQLSLLSVATYKDGTLSGRRSAETSREAATAIDRVLNARQREVLEAFARLGSATADEIGAAVGRRVTSTRPRTTELKARGFLAFTGEKRLTADGRYAFVYRLSTQGAKYLRENL